MRRFNHTLFLLSLVVLWSDEICDGQTQKISWHFYLALVRKVMPNALEVFSVVTGALNEVLHA